MFAKISTPLAINFSFEVELDIFEADISRSHDKGEDHPEQEAVDGEEGAIIEKDTGEADERGEGAQGSSSGRY